MKGVISLKAKTDTFHLTKDFRYTLCNRPCSEWIITDETPDPESVYCCQFCRKKIKVSYVELKAKVRDIRSTAVRIEPEGMPAKWVPLSLLGDASETETQVGKDGFFEVPDWKVEELGWGFREPAGPDELFE